VSLGESEFLYLVQLNDNQIYFESRQKKTPLFYEGGFGVS